METHERTTQLETQLKKGTLELCVLALLCQRDCYGYELVETLSKHIPIAEGTIYPLLRRLQAEGTLSSYSAESAEGPMRKYYQATPQGKELYKALLDTWDNYSKSIDALMKGLRP